jgi:MraZ protein
VEEKAVRHPILYGEFELAIDDKNRVLVPAEVRKAINRERDGEGFFLVVGINGKPWLYTERYYEHVVSQVPSDLTPGDELLAYDQMHFALASRLEWDKQGRVLIPEKTLRRTGLDREITMIGARDHLELWNRPQWDSRREELLGRSQDVAQRAKQARTGG